MAAPLSASAANTEQAVLRKVLTRLVPFLALLYTFNILDRGNVAIAALTMEKDLRFDDAVYGLGAGMFFVGYFFLEVPSNLILERVGARRWISRIMISWGLVSASTLLVRTPLQFYSLRFLLGVAEAGFYPGILLYLTYWTPAAARARVIARFLALSAMLGLFSGPLGGLLLRLNGVLGVAGWRWLFLVEGIPSILLGLLVLAILPDGPEEVRWLSAEEKGWMRRRLQQEGASKERVHRLSWRVALTDLRVLHLCLIFILCSTAGNAVGFFGPQLIKSRSGGAWSDSFVATVTIIPALVGAVAMLWAAAHSDQTGRRRQHVAVGYLVAALGFVGCVVSPDAWWILAALSLNALGERCGTGSYWALTTNLMGARAAAGGLAFINSVGNLGGFFGPTLMGALKKASGGGYTAGLCTAAALMVAAAVLGYFYDRQPAPESLATLQR